MKKFSILFALTLIVSGVFVPFFSVYAYTPDDAKNTHRTNCGETTGGSGTFKETCDIEINNTIVAKAITCTSTGVGARVTTTSCVDQKTGTYTLTCTAGDAFGSDAARCDWKLPDGTSASLTDLGGATVTQGCDAQGHCETPQVNSPVASAVSWVAGLFGGAVAWVVLQAGVAILMLLIQFGLFILYLVGLMFNFVVSQLVIGMGAFVTSGGAEGVRLAWTIVRDLVNIGIIGGLVAIAIGTILQTGASANKYLARLIIAALLVNFSYFFAGAIIDSSNYLAGQFYTATICKGQADCGGRTIAGRFYAITNIQKIQAPVANLQAEVNNKGKNDQIDAGNEIGISGASIASGALKDFAQYLLFFILICVTIFVFLSAVALLIGRFVALIFLLITSPIGIAGSAIPGVSKYAKEWWSILFSQAFFAPVYFLLVGFSLTILEGSVQAILGASDNYNEPTVGIIITFIVATAFMLMSLKIAKQMSESGKQYFGDIYKGADKLAGWMPKAYTGALKWAGGSTAVYTAGRAGDVAARKYTAWMSNAPDGSWRKRLAGTAADRRVAKSLEAVSKAKFGTKEGYADTLHAREERNKVLSEEKKFQEALAKEKDLAKRREMAELGRKGYREKYGDLGTREQAENDLASKLFGKKYADSTPDEQAAFRDELAKNMFGERFENLSDEEQEKLKDEVAKEKFKGRKWKNLKNAEKAEVMRQISNHARFDKKFDALTDVEKARVMEQLGNEKLVGKKFADLTSEQKQKAMATDEWKNIHADLDTLAKEQYSGRAWADLTDEERKRLTENPHWLGRKWESQGNGTYGWETGFLYDDRLHTRMDYRTDAEKDAEAMAKHGKKYAELTAPEIASLDSKKKLTLQGAIDDQRIALNEVSWARIKEEQLRDHGTLKKLTPMFSTEQYMEALADKSISRAEKREMRDVRMGSILRESQKFEDNVVELEAWEKLTADQKKTKVLRGSAEYDAYRWSLHERLKKYHVPEEIVEFVESDNGLETEWGEGDHKETFKKTLRDNRIFNDAITNGVYMSLQKSKKISSGQRRGMRALKRTRYENAIKEDEASKRLFDDYEKETGRKLDQEERDYLAYQAADQNDLEVALSLEEYEKESVKRGGEKSLEGKLFKAAWLRKRAEQAADKYFGGKTPEEVADEVKQESYGTRLAGKYMRKDQMNASGKKDQAWQDKQGRSKAVYGSDEDVSWLKFSDYGQRYNVDWEAVDKERKEIGLHSVSEALAKARKTKGGYDEDEELEVPDIAERNAEAIGAGVARAQTSGTRVSIAENEIREVLARQAQEAQSIENLHPENTVEPIEEIIDDMRLDEVTELSSDILSNPRVAAGLDKEHILKLLTSDISLKTRRTLIDNIARYNSRKEVRTWLRTEANIYKLSDEQRKLLEE